MNSIYQEITSVKTTFVLEDGSGLLDATQAYQIQMNKQSEKIYVRNSEIQNVLIRFTQQGIDYFENSNQNNLYLILKPLHRGKELVYHAMRNNLRLSAQSMLFNLLNYSLLLMKLIKNDVAMKVLQDCIRIINLEMQKPSKDLSNSGVKERLEQRIYLLQLKFFIYVQFVFMKQHVDLNLEKLGTDLINILVQLIKDQLNIIQNRKQSVNFIMHNKLEQHSPLTYKDQLKYEQALLYIRQLQMILVSNEEQLDKMFKQNYQNHFDLTFKQQKMSIKDLFDIEYFKLSDLKLTPANDLIQQEAIITFILKISTGLFLQAFDHLILNYKDSQAINPSLMLYTLFQLLFHSLFRVSQIELILDRTFNHQSYVKQQIDFFKKLVNSKEISIDRVQSFNQYSQLYQLITTSNLQQPHFGKRKISMGSMQQQVEELRRQYESNKYKFQAQDSMESSQEETQKRNNFKATEQFKRRQQIILQYSVKQAILNQKQDSQRLRLSYGKKVMKQSRINLYESFSGQESREKNIKRSISAQEHCRKEKHARKFSQAVYSRALSRISNLNVREDLSF